MTATVRQPAGRPGVHRAPGRGRLRRDRHLPNILLAALRTLAEVGLQDELPHLTLVRDLTLDLLPAGHFDVVHAHSVFSHSPIEVIEECLAHAGRVMRPDGFFDFTFDRTEGAEHHVLREDFYYRTETLVALAGRYGLTGRFMTD